MVITYNGFGFDLLQNDLFLFHFMLVLQEDEEFVGHPVAKLVRQWFLVPSCVGSSPTWLADRHRHHSPWVDPGRDFTFILSDSVWMKA